MKLLIFVRHGETDATTENKFIGLFDDTKLTKIGKQQANSLARFCKKNKINRIISSPSQRTLETAKIISKENELPINIDSNLKECCYGCWEGVKKEDLILTKDWKDREGDKFNFIYPGLYKGEKGESYASLYKKIFTLLQNLVKALKDGERVIIITHMGVVRCAKMYFEHLGGQNIIDYNPKTNEAYSVKIFEKKIKTSHSFY